MGLIRSGKTKLTPVDDASLINYLWPIVREMIKTAIENNQNLIIEGCYIPSYWRKDFEKQYLSSIRFICLAMSEEFIEKNFNEIIAHESDIESRLIKADFTKEELKKDNKQYINSFTNSDDIIIIEKDYESTLNRVIEKFN